jgi:DNA-binding PadR family transcriptional regulator
LTATKLEVLLAIASSEFHQTTHVHYMPVGKKFTGMLRNMRAQGFIEPLNTNYYTLTTKGWNYIRTQNKTRFTELDKAVDTFVDGLK